MQKGKALIVAENSIQTALGLMSGTSLDGIDAAILRTDGERLFERGPAITVPYTGEEREILRRATAVAAECARGQRDLPAEIGAAEGLVTEAHGRVAERLIGELSAEFGTVVIVGFHGQTLLHRPAQRWTWQIGDGAALAKRLGLTVVDDFRSADVASGGEGAPLAPLYHRALVKSLDRREAGPVAILNIGGVANITWVGEDDTLSAFDTGPGNGLLDDWMQVHTGRNMDLDGLAAAKGTVDYSVLEQLLDHPYFAKPAPKSLDRHDFDLAPLDGLTVEDGAATLVQFTARSVAQAGMMFAAQPVRWLVTGGGRHNPTLMAALSEALGVAVDPVEAVGWRGDALEAEAFAFLAVTALRRQPLSFPSTTGVPWPMTGGEVHWPQQ